MDVEQFLTDLKAVVRDGQQLLRATVGTVKAQAITGMRSTDRLVRERPYQTLGVAFGLGLAVGLVVSGIFKGEAEERDD